jgi:hypothetical protein
MIEVVVQAVPRLLHVVEHGNSSAQHYALLTLMLLSGVSASLLEQLATPSAIGMLAHRAWHGKAEVQAVALLLLRGISKNHSDEFLRAGGDALPLMIGLEGSLVPDVAHIAKDALSQLAGLPAVQEERSVQARLFGDDHQSSQTPLCQTVLLSYVRMDLEHSGRIHRCFIGCYRACMGAACCNCQS